MALVAAGCTLTVHMRLSFGFSVPGASSVPPCGQGWRLGVGKGVGPTGHRGHLCCLFYLSFSKFDNQDDPRGKQIIRSHNVKWHVWPEGIKDPLGICIFRRGFGYRQVSGLRLKCQPQLCD